MAVYTKAEAGRKGGYRKWAKLNSKKRSAMMREVALARWKKTPEPDEAIS